MLRFYDELLAGEDTLQALHVAQQPFLQRKNMSHPMYWAAFQHYGQPSTLELKGGR